MLHYCRLSSVNWLVNFQLLLRSFHRTERIPSSNVINISRRRHAPKQQWKALKAGDLYQMNKAFTQLTTWSKPSYFKWMYFSSVHFTAASLLLILSLLTAGVAVSYSQYLPCPRTSAWPINTEVCYLHLWGYVVPGVSGVTIEGGGGARTAPGDTLHGWHRTPEWNQ